MKCQSAFSLSLCLLLLHFTGCLTQSPAAAPGQSPPAPQTPTPPAPQKLPPPAPPAPVASPPTQDVPVTSGPTNVTKILEKAGRFTIFIRLLRATQEDNKILSELNDTSSGITIFAPTDGAFSALRTGTLNTLNDEEKAKLVKFHIIPVYLSTSQFQTVTNPVKTEAGAGPRASVNVTAYPNSVNITSGLTNTSISGTVYTDNQLAIYRIEDVLLPPDVFSPNSTAPAPAPAGAKKPKQKAPTADTPAAVTPVDTSGAEKYTHSPTGLFGFGVVTVAMALVLA